ncbi:MAG TPA: LytTR family transcriptional regulator [Rikenellaceae bacterium]|nr:LytTR family transcriptional regulator [Rikenellaceae bacterium]HCV15409.1 LytTR family transcriptional regulator [Rikenellaceae bacterium]
MFIMQIPEYINKKKNIVRLVGFTALFALVFINIYKPFSSSGWYKVSEFMFLVYSSIIILTGVLVVVISRLIMYFYSKRHKISYWKYGIWVFTEIFLMSCFYTFYTLLLNPDRDIMEIFEGSLKNTTLVLLLPYFVLWFYFGWRDSVEKLAVIENPDEVTFLLPGSIAFTDEKGVLRLSLSGSDLLYIESSDNYVLIHYSVNEKIKRYLLRNTLKNLERELENTMVTRCHRSFLVNLERVKVIRRDKDGLYIELDAPGSIDLPVSKSYQRKVSEKFLAHSFKDQK